MRITGPSQVFNILINIRELDLCLVGCHFDSKSRKTGVTLSKPTHF